MLDNDNNFKNYSKDGLELVINVKTGEVFATQRALARMCQRNESTIRTWLTARKVEAKTAEVLTATGFKTARLLNIKAIAKAVANYNPDMAEQFMELGATLVLQRLVGYEQTLTQVLAQVDKTIEQLRLEHRTAHNIMQDSTAKFKVASNVLARACVQAVTGASYNEVMDGVEYAG